MRPKVSRLNQINRKAKFAIAIFLIALLVPTYFVIARASETETRFIQLNFIALLIGLIFEFIRISMNWRLVLWASIGCYAFSFVAFFPYKNESPYIFEDHLENWPYIFLGLFIIVALFSQYSKTTQKLHEGLTLILSLSINYWIIANDYWATSTVFAKILIILNGVLSLITIFNAVSYRELTRGCGWFWVCGVL